MEEEKGYKIFIPKMLYLMSAYDTFIINSGRWIDFSILK